jgi:hypothetical protein
MGFPRRPRHWEGPLGSYVSDLSAVGVSRILSHWGQPRTTSAIYKWLSGAAVPDIRAARVLVSASRGRLSLDDIYSHSEKVKHGDGNGTNTRRVRRGR